MEQRTASLSEGSTVDYRRSNAETVVPQGDSRPTCKALGCGETATLRLTIRWCGGELVQEICARHELPLAHLRRVARGDVVVWESAL